MFRVVGEKSKRTYSAFERCKFEFYNQHQYLKNEQTLRRYF